MSEIAVGDDVKVFLPGESPWAIVTAVLPDGRIMARLNNDLVRAKLHGSKFGDVATFERETTPEWSIWKLVPLDRQMPVGPRP